MEVMHPRCAGVDVHQKTVVACALMGEPGARPVSEKGTFSTTTRGLLSLRDWLQERQITHVAMESTGVYWKPVWAILEGGFALLLANAAFVKNMPGRKTDAKDAAWLADLLRHGLIRASFVPPVAVQDLRELTRYRAQVSADRARVTQRMQKLLEGGNIKLTSVASSIVGVSGLRMLEAMAQGETDPAKLAAMALGQLGKKRAQLEEALEGRMRDHHRHLLRLALAQWKFLDRLLVEIEQDIEGELLPFRRAVALCRTIPGLKKKTAATAVVAEVGLDMGVFPNVAQASSWAALCPGNNESAGKRLSGKTRKGNPWLKRILCQAAWAASRTKGSYFQAQFRRICNKRGKKRAIIAVAHSLLAVVITVLRAGKPYQELGADYFLKLEAQKNTRYHLRALTRLGYRVSIEQEAA
jgi:transposase